MSSNERQKKNEATPRCGRDALLRGSPGSRLTGPPPAQACPSVQPYVEFSPVTGDELVDCAAAEASDKSAERGMIGASPSSGLVAIQCALALVRDAASIRGQWANCSQLDAMLHHAGNKTTFTTQISVRSLALHHVLSCKHKILARRDGANGHRDAYLVRCGRLRGHPHLAQDQDGQTHRQENESRQQQTPGQGTRTKTREPRPPTMRRRTRRRKASLPLSVLRDGEQSRTVRRPAWDWPIQRNKVRHDAAARQVWAHPFDKGARWRLERRLCVASPRRGSAQQIGWRRGLAQHPGLLGSIDNRTQGPPR